MKLDCFIQKENLMGFETAIGIRRAVFCEEQGCSIEEEPDGFDTDETWHWLIYDQDNPVATGRMYALGKTAIVGRMAVLKSHRGKGLGLMILEDIVKKAQALGFKRTAMHAQCHAIGFYQKLGFVPFGKEFLEENIPHIEMEKILA